jgi:MFS-type transporter involved in bile tolerance (Atg22 family)
MRCFAGPYAIGLIKDKMGSLHWGLAFVGIFMLVSAMFLVLLPKRARVRSA